MIKKIKPKNILIDSSDTPIYLGKVTNFPNLLMEEGYKMLYLNESNVRILKSNLPETVDYNASLTYNNNNHKIEKEYFFYYDEKLDIYIETERTDSPDYFGKEHNVGEGYARVSNIYYKRDSENIDDIIEFINNNFETNYLREASVGILMNKTSGLYIKDMVIDNTMRFDLKLYNDDFKSVYEHIIESLTNKKKGVVFLHGAAGTGKTNLIRHLCSTVENKRFIFIPNSMIGLLDSPSFLPLLLSQDKEIVLIIEDAENYIKDRGVTESSVVATILNLTDGILSDLVGCQIICTFNAKLTQVDSALLRKGRLIDEYEFKELTEDKAKVLCDELGVEVPDSRTLAEIYNSKDGSHKETKETKKIGFYGSKG